MPARVTLRVVAGPIQGRAFSFDKHDTFLFGRAADCHAQLAENDGTASRHHFLLEVNPPAARLRDLGSMNGTHVNGSKYGGRGRNETPEEAAARAQAQVDLHHGDQVRVGQTVFEIDVAAACAACGRDLGPPPRGSAAAGLLCVPCGRAPLSDAAGMIASLVDAPTPLPAAGTEVAGYDVGRLLGKGGMGAVYLARRRADGMTVALKVMLAHAAVDDIARENFRREIEITRALRHDAIVGLLDHGSSGNGFYFAMEYCAGGSLHDLLERRGGPLDLPTALRIGLQALHGLAHAHAHGFIHRDLKPENLLATDAAARGVKITDFGLAKSFQEAGLSGMTATGMVAGTLSFMPREQLTNFRQMRPVSDVWSFGATLYYLLTRQYAREFPAGQDPLQVILRGGVVPLRQRDPRLPEDLAAVVDRAVADDVGVRYPDAEEFRRALAPVAERHAR